MNATHIASMFAGMSVLTKEIVTKKLGALLSVAIAEVNKDIIKHCPTDPMSILTPAPEKVFNALITCPIEAARVVIIAQDPYIKPGEAMGLSFSVPKGFPVPPSLKNIYACLIHHNLMKTAPTHGDLTNWSKQGVLLLNSALTTRMHVSNAHAQYWSTFTDSLIESISTISRRPIVFLLLGGFAQEKSAFIDPRKHLILEWGHPSNVNRANGDLANPKHFKYCTAFTQINTHLTLREEIPINWDPMLTAPTQVTKLGLLEVAAPAIAVSKSDTAAEFTRIDTQSRIHSLATFDDGFDDSAPPVTQLNTVVATSAHATSAHATTINQQKTKIIRQIIESEETNAIADAAVATAPIPRKKKTTESSMFAADDKTMIPCVIRERNDTDPQCYTNDVLWIFTDGGSSANGKVNCRAAWAFYMLDDKNVGFASDLVPEKEIPGKVYKTSNNRGELLAILSALKFIRSNIRKFSFESIVIVSDSEYSIESITSNIYKWQRDPIKCKLLEKQNLDMIIPAKDLVESLQDMLGLKSNVVFRHINSHLDEPTNNDSEEWFMWKCNDIVDKLCNVSLGRK